MKCTDTISKNTEVLKNCFFISQHTVEEITSPNYLEQPQLQSQRTGYTHSSCRPCWRHTLPVRWRSGVADYLSRVEQPAAGIFLTTTAAQDPPGDSQQLGQS